MADSTLQVMMGATFDLAGITENKWLSPAQHIESYEQAISAHLKIAERRIAWATRLVYSDKKRRRDLALYWIKDAKTRVIAAETCITLACHIDHVDRPSLMKPWMRMDVGASSQPSIWHRLEILESFLTKPPIRRIRDLTDEIPF